MPDEQKARDRQRRVRARCARIRGGRIPAIALPGDTIVVTTTIQAAVDGYRLTGSKYVDNPVYGPFPVCSRNGLIDLNHVVGGASAVGPSLDTGIYVGDDDQVTVRNNSVTNYVIGVVVENTINATVQDNLLEGTRPAFTWPSSPTTHGHSPTRS